MTAAIALAVSALAALAAAAAFGVASVALRLARSSAGLAANAALRAGLLVAYGLALPHEVQPLVPALQQPVLLTVHVGAAMASYGAGGVAFLAALSEIAQRWGGDRITVLPSAAVSRRAAASAVIVAFPLLTA